MVLAAKDKIRLPLFFILGLLFFAASGCKDEDKLGVAKAVDAENMPQLSTRNVMTLISDSGYTKYKVVTPLWNVYGGKRDTTGIVEEAFWDFPEGVYLRQLDKDLNIVSTVAADSACYFPNRKLWELYGDVEIDQKDKAYFYSSIIFFDDRQRRIYSDQFIHIETPEQTLEGMGFESNEDLTVYRVLKPTGIFPRGQLEGNRHREPIDDAVFEDRNFMREPTSLQLPMTEPDRTEEPEGRSDVSEETEVNNNDMID